MEETSEILSIFLSFRQTFKNEYPEAHEDIENQVQENCKILISKTDIFSDLKLQRFLTEETINVVRNESDSQFNSTYIALACMFRVIDNVTAAYEIEYEWIDYRLAVQPHMERLRDCTNNT